MSTLSYKRRAKGVDAEVVSVFSQEELHLYFKDESEWRLASNIYWERFTLRRHIRYYLTKYNVTVTYFNHLMNQYSRFMLHEYEKNK